MRRGRSPGRWSESWAPCGRFWWKQESNPRITEHRIEDGVERATRAQQLGWEDAREDLREARNEARTHAQQAEAQLVALVQQLLPSDKKVYLHSSGMRQLDLAGLNTVIARVGLVVKARLTYSE